MSVDDFTATIISTDSDSEYQAKSAYIHEVDDSAKTLLVKFPGAPSGEYMIKIDHSSRGRIDSSALLVTTEAKVTAVSANSGSSNGG